MQKIILTCLVMYVFTFSLLAQVGINTPTPNVKSALDVTSTSKGFLPPRMTEAQRNAISNPVPAGLLVWCIDCGVNGQMQVFNGTVWTDMVGETAAAGPFICGTSTVSFIYNGSPVIYGTVVSAGECWLDRNLGASQVATSSVDASAYGDLYQWGRLADGHQITTSMNTSTLSGTDNPGHGDFILAPINPNDWRSPQNDNLWQGVSGVNNPCPTGFRVPTELELDAERLSWSSYNDTGAFASPLKLSVPGYRIVDDGSFSSVGVTGFYWSTNVDGNVGRSLFFFYNSAGMGGGAKASGCSVRCIKD